MAKELETRKCIFTGQILPKAELLRFVVLKDGTFLPDFGKKLPERGVYLSNSKRLLTELTQLKKPLNKILHTDVIIGADIPQIVEQILSKKGLEAINLARKAGALILGFEMVSEALHKGKADAVIIAADAGADGKQKLFDATKGTECYILYDTNTLSQALNRDNTVYLAVKKGAVSAMVRGALQKYQTYMNG